MAGGNPNPWDHPTLSKEAGLIFDIIHGFDGDMTSQDGEGMLAILIAETLKKKRMLASKKRSRVGGSCL